MVVLELIHNTNLSFLNCRNFCTNNLIVMLNTLDSFYCSLSVSMCMLFCMFTCMLQCRMLYICLSQWRNFNFWIPCSKHHMPSPQRRLCKVVFIVVLIAFLSVSKVLHFYLAPQVELCGVHLYLINVQCTCTCILDKD